MSWTSEFELPPQGPQVVPEDESSTEEGDTASPAIAEPEPEPVGQGFELSDIPEEGPLDPSVFDGLFTDLSEEEPEDYVQPDTFDLLSDPAVDDEPRAEEASVDETVVDEAIDETVVDDFDELLDEDFEDDGIDAFDEDELPHQTEADETPQDLEDLEVEPQVLEPQELEPQDADLEVEPLEDAAPEELEPEHFEPEDLAAPEELEPEHLELEDPAPEEPQLEDPGIEDLEDLEDTALEDPALEDPALEDPAPEDLEDSEEPEPLESPLEEIDFEDVERDPQSEFGYSSDDNGISEPEAGQDPDRNTGGGFKLFDPAAAAQAPAVAPPAQIIEQPLPAVATSPPIALDDPYTEHIGLPAEPYHELPAAAVVDQLNPTIAAAPTRRRWPAFVTAIVVGGTLGIGGAVLLTRMQNDGDETAGSSQAPLVANEVTAQQESTSETTGGEAEGGNEGQSDSPSLLADGQLIAHAIGFVPGTTELTETSQATLQLVAASVAELPPEPTAITVRTFTQSTAEANRELSEQQAAAVGNYLSSLGVEFGGLTLRGVGAAPLAPAMPVENFVVARASLRTTGITESLSAIGPFEIGIDPDSLQLRPESIRALSQIGAALNANAEGSVSLAGYSYDRPTNDANKAMATAAVDAAREYLTTTHQIDPARLLVLAPGSLPYVLGPAHGGHIEIKRGRSVAVDVAIHSVEQPLVSFAAGSDALSGAAAEELGRIADLLIEAQAQAVISVRSSGEPSADANSRLSGLQADAIASYLADTGLAEGQVRVYGVGDIERLRSANATSEVTITVLP